jgi:hypothetical protein
VTIKKGRKDNNRGRPFGLEQARNIPALSFLYCSVEKWLNPHFSNSAPQSTIVLGEIMGIDR